MTKNNKKEGEKRKKKCTDNLNSVNPEWLTKYWKNDLRRSAYD